MPKDTPYQSLVTHLANCQNESQIHALLTALLTNKEQLDIANRIRIFDLLEQGITQREISKRLGVGIATVSRGAKAMQDISIDTNANVDDLLKTYRVQK